MSDLRIVETNDVGFDYAVSRKGDDIRIEAEFENGTKVELVFSPADAKDLCIDILAKLRV